MKLVIAEKPSVGKSIAQVLAAKEKNNGYIKGNGYIVSWCVGHLVGLANPDLYNEKYKKWNIDDLPIIPDEFILVVNESTKEQYNILKNLMNSNEISEIICATDSGREGELIFRYVYQKTNCNKPVKRLWVSSLTDEAIKNGFENLKDIEAYNNLYEAGFKRSIADWIIGINASRFYSALYNNKINVGRVQTPTLNIVVERENKIKNFTKEKYYEIVIEKEDLKAKTEKITSLEEAKKVFETIKNNSLTCDEYTTVEKSKSPNKLYDLTTLQRESNNIFGYTANETLTILQGLYEKKIVTYPRTDSKYISDDMENGTKEILNILYNKFDFLKNLEPICNVSQVVNNDKVTDHHAIIPTKLVKDLDFSSLNEKEQNILNLVIKTLLIATNEKCIIKEINGILKSSNDIRLNFSYKNIIKKGYVKIEEIFSNKEKENLEAPIILKGEEITDFKTSLDEKETTPPKRYTEDTLLSAMENASNDDYKELDVEDIDKKGLGTPATRASIIESLVTNGYIERKGKGLIPTEKGINTIKIVNESLKSPKLTANWEVKLQQMEKNNYSPNKFLDEIIEFTKSIIENKSIDENVANSLKMESNLESLGNCPICSKNVYEWEKAFSCEDKNCRFIIFKNSKFFADKKAKITKSKVKELLDKGKTKMKFYSQKTDKDYEAYISLDITEKYINFKMEF